jgi:hypothetical protein
MNGFLITFAGMNSRLGERKKNRNLMKNVKYHHLPYRNGVYFQDVNRLGHREVFILYFPMVLSWP